MSKFIITDSAQVEARVLAWLSGQDDLLQGFADGEDVYSQFATTLFKCTVRKPDEEDPEPVQKYLTIKRGFGKDAVLGAGFGLGASRFYERCLQNPDLRPLFDSGAYDFKFVQALIKTYRTTYSKIPQFWTKIEKCFKWVVKYPNATAQYGPLNLWNNSGTVCIELPSTRVLYYRHAKLSSHRELSYQHGSLWGGSICLAGYTEVLTSEGWLELQDVEDHHNVWDGTKWAKHCGLVCKGEQPVIGLNGIDMTKDHRVLINEGRWVRAKKAQGFTWAKVRRPGSYRESWFKWKKLAVAGEMPMREGIQNTGQRFNPQAGFSVMPLLCLPQKRQKQNSWNGQPSSVLGLAFHAEQMLPTITSCLEKLWRSWHQSLQTMAGVFYSFLGRYERWLCPRASIGQNRQQQGLRTGKLQVGSCQAKQSEQTNKFTAEHTHVVGRNRNMSVDTVLQTCPRHPVTPVYDLIDCGDRNCFTVRDKDGKLRLVHNCENLVQAIARDLLGYWILEFEDRGFPVVLHSHDEIVTITDGAEKRLDEALAIMRSAPDWAGGIPLDAEGCVSEVYTK